jgi:hypothetical protein
MRSGKPLRVALAITALVLLVTYDSGCDPVPPGPSDATLLREGNRELDAVQLPSGWETASPPTSGREKGHLRWDRRYRAPVGTEDAVRSYDTAVTAAGWTRSSDCTGPNGQRCFTYDKGRFHLFPTFTPGPCPDGKSSCLFIDVWMSLN